jgi:16S rRNA (uracil1498-N3)-methyltransferase
MQQYFVNEILNVDALYKFDKQQSHHVVNVMRMKNDNVVRLVDKYSNPFLATILYINEEVYAKITEQLDENHELPIKVTLILALIKNDKWDLVLQKACELGVSEIIPFESSRTVVKVNTNINKKIIRWKKILQEASEQCKRTVVPCIHDPIKFKQIKEYQNDLNFVAYEDLNNPREFAKELKIGKNVNLVIGPEGGFSKDEVEYLNNNGFVSVRLGKRILRAETASMYALSCVSAILENEEL